MVDAEGISVFLQRRLVQEGLDEVTAVEAASWLDGAGVLKDSEARPGLPLRNLLRDSRVPQAEQPPPIPHGRWVIVREGRHEKRSGYSGERRSVRIRHVRNGGEAAVHASLRSASVVHIPPDGVA